MTIRDLLAAESINLNGTPAGKTEALNQCIDLMAKSGKIADVEKYRKGVFVREEEGTTGIGMGIAIPHCKSDAVTKAGLAAMVVKDGVDFESLDGTPAKIIFLIAAPNTEDNVHLQVLSKLSVMLMDEQFTNSLINAGSVDEFLNIIDSAEKAKDEKEAAKEAKAKESVEVKKDDVFIVAVTACPTGIAHTYMAAEAIEKKAKELGYQIKVETRGSGGAKNVLTDDEIAKAAGVIVACDTNVPTDRFDGKKVIECQVSDGINKAEELIKRIASGDAPVFKASGKKEDSHSSVGGKESIGHQIYKHLMNGVSHMLPFVVGGGILIAIAFLIDGFSVDLNSLPAEQRANFGTITQAAALFKGIGGTAFGFMLPILAGFIAMSIADRPGLAVGFVGGSIAANGTSGFLGALVAGFVAGYIVLLLKKVFSKLPESLDGMKPVLLYPLFGIFLVGVIMQFVVEPPIGALNTAINNGLNGLNGASAVVLGVLLGGMMSVDMGGPVNKAAYVTGTGLLAGLWEFPHVSGTLEAREALAQLEQWGLVPEEVRRSSDRIHIFTHIQWNMRGWYIRCANRPANFTWAAPDQLDTVYALPTAFRQFREE